MKPLKEALIVCFHVIVLLGLVTMIAALIYLVDHLLDVSLR